RGVAADRGGAVGGRAADAGGAEVDRTDADRVEDPGLAGGSGDVDGGIGGEQLMVRSGAEVDEHAVGDAGELPGVGLMVEHRRGRTDGQEHVRAELLHDGVRDALDEWMSRTQSCVGRTQVEVNHDDPFASMAQIRFDGCSLSLCDFRFGPSAWADRHEAPHVIDFDCISPTGAGRVRDRAQRKPRTSRARHGAGGLSRRSPRADPLASTGPLATGPLAAKGSARRSHPYPRPTYLWPRRLSASTTTAVSRTSAVMICCASELKPMR